MTFFPREFYSLKMVVPQNFHFVYICVCVCMHVFFSPPLQGKSIRDCLVTFMAQYL